MSDTAGGTPSLNTVTATEADVVVLPAASRATAVNVCAPLAAVVVVHDWEYGAVVSSAPRLAPSSLNRTPTTPTLSEALAATVTALETVAPAAGPVIETNGDVPSDVCTVMVELVASRLVESFRNNRTL